MVTPAADTPQHFIRVEPFKPSNESPSGSIDLGRIILCTSDPPEHCPEFYRRLGFELDGTNPPWRKWEMSQGWNKLAFLPFIGDKYLDIAFKGGHIQRSPPNCIDAGFGLKIRGIRPERESISTLASKLTLRQLSDVRKTELESLIRISRGSPEGDEPLLPVPPWHRY